MCGITGIINLNKEPVNRDLINKMNDLISYRGPDDEGFYFDDESGIAFGHRRLSIIDLSKRGHQPMPNQDQSLWITYNGEIYNYIELREELISKGHHFNSNSDTEVIIKSYQQWGEDCVKKFNGMWAFAIWDKTNKKIFCSRDRFGVKPFYYFFNKKVFIFSSEIKQILMHPEYRFSPNKSVLYDYLISFKFNITEKTFYENINQLMGSNSLTLDLSTESPLLKIKEYWDIDLDNQLENLSEQEYSDEFSNRFYNSIKLRLRSDVPVASCLSGGLDSSSIVCMANQQLKDMPNKSSQETFCSCHKDKRFDETEFAKAVEEKINIKSNYIYPDPQYFKEEIKDLVWHMDGPTVNGSIYCQRCIFKAANQRGIKVMLDGQGGDELLAGYHDYFAYYLIQLIKERKFITFLKELFHLRQKYNYRLNDIFRKIRSTFTNINNIDKEKFRWLNKDFQNYHLNSSAFLNTRFMNYTSNSLKNELYKLIKYTNMPSLLHYEDRNSMTFSIESRVPFLDYKLVEYVFSIPNNQKIRNGKTKIVLRNAMKHLLPEKVLNRIDKMGFESPDKVWIDSIFKDYLWNLINSTAAKELDIFDLDELRELVKTKSLPAGELWRILGTILWYEITKEKILEFSQSHKDEVKL